MAIVVTTVGKAAITAIIVAAAAPPKFIGWGTGSGQTVSSTTLATEAAETSTTKVTGTIAQATTTLTNDTVRVTGTVTASAGRAITEAATFTAASAGTMVVYGDFTVINLSTSDSIAFTIDLQLT